MTELADIGGAGAAAPVYVAGDHLELVVTVLDSSGGSPVNVTGITDARFVITRSDAGGNPVGAALVSKTLGGGIAVTDGPAGEITVTLDNGDTGTLAGTYRHELEITDADGRISTVLIGGFGVVGQAILPD